LAIARFDRFNPSKAERKSFGCGDEPLTDWLVRYAGQNMDERNAVVYLLHEERRIVGYYTLSSGSVSREEATETAARKAPDPVPAVLLGRMAVEAERQGLGYGSRMLQHAIQKALAARELIGARCLLVHALNERVLKFYVDRGFDPSPIAPWTVMLPLKDAAHTVDVLSGRA